MRHASPSSLWKSQPSLLGVCILACLRRLPAGIIATAPYMSDHDGEPGLVLPTTAGHTTNFMPSTRPVSSDFPRSGRPQDTCSLHVREAGSRRTDRLPELPESRAGLGWAGLGAEQLPSLPAIARHDPPTNGRLFPTRNVGNESSRPGAAKLTRKTTALRYWLRGLVLPRNLDVLRSLPTSQVPCEVPR